MAIITVSRGSFSRGKEVAEKVAQRLGYECISRDILLEASDRFNTPEIKLIRAIHDAPSILDRLGHGKQRYIAYIKAALLGRVRQDNVVYHGLAGHYFLQGVSHVLKVRIIADIEDRVREEMRRRGISAEEARRILTRDDEERSKWGLGLYGVDTGDPKLYDMTLHVKTLLVEDIVELVAHAVSLPHFRTTPESQKALDDLCLAAQVQAALVESWPEVRIQADRGRVKILTQAPLSATGRLTEDIAQLARGAPGVEEVEVEVTPLGYQA